MGDISKWKMHRACILTIFLLAVSVLASCTSPITSGGGTGGASNVQIDWINFIKFNGITYSGYLLNQGRQLVESDLGPEFAKVAFKVSGNVNSPGYQIKNGDAAFLDAGTVVYTVKGYKPVFRLAVHDKNQQNSIVLFESDTNPNAKKGVDLLDIGGKVKYIGINSVQDEKTELAAITNQKQVAALVTMVLTAPVDQSHQSQNERQYFIAFHLADGTIVTRSFGMQSGELSRGMLLPKAFGDAITQALKK
jgi:hypothetical protein